MWLSDSGPEYGYVKWLGKLPDVGPDWMAGVDFDNPVGSGTGLYNDHQLFEARMNHASLVPVIGLMKAEDFDGNDTRDSSSPELKVSKGRSRVDQLPPLNLPFAATSSNNSSAVHHLQQHMSDLILPDPKPNNESFQSQAAITNSHSRPSFRSEATLPSLPSSSRRDNRLDAMETKEKEEKSNALFPQTNGKLTLNHGSTDGLEIGSLVIVTLEGLPRFGVIRWIGYLDSYELTATAESPNHHHLNLIDEDSPQENDRFQPTTSNKLMAGVELEEECPGCCDGTWGSRRLFSCSQRRGCFVPLSQCKKDNRFNLDRRRSALFGSIDCPSVSGDVPPLSSQEDLQALCGKNRGIQGHHNSCYLDATLFAMFSCTTIFESLLNRPPTPDDIPEVSISETLEWNKSACHELRRSGE